MSPLPFAIASTMSLPLCSVFLLIWIPCCAKNPFWMPRSSGSPFAIGSVSTVTVVSFLLPVELAAEPPNSTAHASTETVVTANSLLVIAVLLLGPFSRRNRQLPLDQPVHVRAQVHELGQLLRGDLVARPAEVDPHDLLHFGGRVREHDHPVGEVDRLVDVVGDEQDRDAVLLAHAQHKV